MIRKASAVLDRAAAEVPPFDPTSRGPSWTRSPETVLVAATLYAFAHDLGPNRHAAARTLADEWLAA